MSDTNLKVHKAEGVTEREPVPSLLINVSAALPTDLTLETASGIYARDGEMLAASLHDSLPGGTFDRLMIYMMLIKASHFRVPHERPLMGVVKPEPAEVRSDTSKVYSSQGSSLSPEMSELMNAKIRAMIIKLSERVLAEAQAKDEAADKAATPQEKIRLMITRDVLMSVARVFADLAE